MFNRVTLPLICALAVALSLVVPVCSFADAVDDACAERESDGFANEYDQGSGSYANSWRYGNADAYGEGTGFALFANRLNSWWNEGGVWYGSNGTIVNSAVGFGVDVSEHQGNIDWSQVQSSGVTYAILRCGYGSDYSNQDDKQFLRNVQECQRYGIPFGVYLYSYATDNAMAQSEAEHTLRLLREAGLSPYSLSYPVYYDMEDENQQGKFGSAALGSIASTYCNAIAAAGYTPGVYANTNWWTNRLTDSAFSSWPRWVAQYNYKCTYSGKYGMWQADSNTLINGIAGGVDINFDFAGPIRHKDTWVFSNGSWWYQYKNGSYPSNGWAYIDDAWYYFDSAGWMQTGWVISSGSWYYLNSSGAMLNGWQWINGFWYYLSPSNGAMTTGWLKEGQNWYWLTPSGAMAVGWADAWGTWYYMGGNGAMLSGWQWINGSWYYLDPANGAMATGWLKEGQNWYWLSGSGAMGVGWLFVNGSWYWSDNSGCLRTGWNQIGANCYYLDPASCAMRVGWIDDEGTWYYCNGSGAMGTGWQFVNGSWYCFSDAGKMLVGEQIIEGVSYRFASSGAMVTGWFNDGEAWHFYSGSGAMKSSSWEGDYYLLEDGAMAKDQWIGSYYVGSDGRWIPGY